MLALFDSGRGGLNTVGYLKASGDGDSLIYLIDQGNAPYGTKTESEILRITGKNIATLCGMGAERVLIACCTASTVHPYLPTEYKEVSIPIIDSIASEARQKTQSGRIGVIATEHTVRSGAFRQRLGRTCVIEHPLSELVTLIDGGLSDLTAKEDDALRLEEALLPVLRADIDTLILGCTHFPALECTIKAIAERYGDIRLINSARVGADALRNCKYGK